MTDRTPPARPPSNAELIETLLNSAPHGARADNPPPVSITINLAAGAVLNVSIGAGRNSKEG